jgi:hypothetical protein
MDANRHLKQPHMFLVTEALAVQYYLGHHFLKPGNFANISVSKLLHSVQSAGLLNA